MADKLPEVRNQKISEVLARLNDDLIDKPTDFAPPRVREPQLAPEMLSVADSTAQTIMAGIEEAEKKVADLRSNAESVIKQLKAWANEHESQRVQLLEQCNVMSSATNASVECILAIGKKPINGNSKGE